MTAGQSGKTTEQQMLWEGPSKLITIRTSKNGPMKSLLKSTYREPTGIRKQHREGLVHLDRLGFDADEHAFAVHGGPEKAVLQYNPDHYPGWRNFFRDIKMVEDEKREELLNLGGFGENIAVENVEGMVPMDEKTMCIGDLVGFYRPKNNNEAVDSKTLKSQARMRVTGPRLPCFKLNHRFGVPNMSQRAQDKFWTGWLYSIDAEGDVQAGDQMVLLERPFPQWPIAKIQQYLFKEPKNLDMIKEALDTLGNNLVFDVKGIFESRFTKGTEDMSTRLQGEEQKDVFTKYRLRERIRHTTRVSEFVFERIVKTPRNSKEFMTAKSGSHIRLRLKPQNGSKIVRPYSVIHGDSNVFRIGVALADQSKGGSSYLHRQLKVGDIIECSDKFANTFPLSEDAVQRCETKHVFLAGGIGITAFLDHMKYCVETKQNFHLHYMIRNQSDYAFKNLIESTVNSSHGNRENSFSSTSLSSTSSSSLDEESDDAADSDDESASSNSSKSSFEPQIQPQPQLQSYPYQTESQAKVTTYISAEGTKCDLKAVLSDLATEPHTQIYICGSEKMGDTIRAQATELKIPESRLHFEEFNVDGSGDPFVAELTRSKKRIEVGARQTLLEALRDTGLDIPSVCEAGSCGTCKVRVKCGRVQHKGTGLQDDEKAGCNGDQEGEMLTCVSRGIGSIALEV